MRGSGILMHISSLPSAHGIGTLGAEAYKFVDFLKESGQTYWQILPVGPTSFGDSPYQSFSAFAGCPYFIDLDLLKNEAVLINSDYIDVDFGDNPTKVDYKKLFDNRFIVLKKAYANFKNKPQEAFNDFKQKHKSWLDNYSLYMAVKYYFNNEPWYHWEENIKLRKPDALKYYTGLLSAEIDFWSFLQFKFYQQWFNLKLYANSSGIKIIGDIPIYVSLDSSDVWANPSLFMLNDDLSPAFVAGCPPDSFSKAGQLWGNPLYNWKLMKNNDYDWWVKRISTVLSFYDTVRIDHFRGIESYYAIPAKDNDAKNGHWEKGPDIELFNIIKQKLGDVSIIAEDLGYLTDDVRKLLAATGYPGMKVLQFAFDSREENDYLPHNYNKNCVVYTGTHDNDTSRGWFNSDISEDIQHCRKYLNFFSDEEYFAWEFIRAAWASVADTAIAPMQDFLNLGSKARMNIPSTLGGNWQWRALPSDINIDLSGKIKDLTVLYGRNP